MSFSSMDDEAVRQALEDAACGSGMIQEFLQLRAAGQTEAAARLLACHRCRLLRAMHEAQRPLDILDYLIDRFKRESQSGQPCRGKEPSRGK